MQFSFNSGEWAPALNARVDIAKYHSGAALLRTFSVDYRAAPTASPCTKYILQTKLTSTARLIPFQASLAVSYVFEFGEGYIRFFNNGAPILESTIAITGITNTAGEATLSVINTYSPGDWLFISGVGGATQLNGNYYIISAASGTQIRLTDLVGNAILFASLSPYTAGGTVQRVYTIGTPYQANELSLIKFVQNVDTMILCHPNHVPIQLVLVAATNWVLSAITFGTTIATPTGLLVQSTLAADVVYYAYVVTSVDVNGQESAPSAYATIGAIKDIRLTAGTNFVRWIPVAGAVSYNVYRANPNYNSPVPDGSIFGFIGNVTGVILADSNIGPDFSSGPPVIQNPFTGGGTIATIILTSPGVYTTVPTITLSASPGVTATAVALLQCNIAAINAADAGYLVGDTITLSNGVILQVTTTGGVVTLHTIA